MPMTIAIPVALSFLLPAEAGQEPKKIHIPEGTLLEVDEASNFCIMGGFLPEDPKEAQFENESSTAKISNFRVVNTRAAKTTTGGIRTYEASQYAEVRGQLFDKAEQLRSGARVVVAGFFQTRKAPGREDGPRDENGQPKPRYLPSIFVRDLAVLSLPKGERKEKAERKTFSRKAASAPPSLKVPA